MTGPFGGGGGGSSLDWGGMAGWLWPLAWGDDKAAAAAVGGVVVAGAAAGGPLEVRWY